MDDAIADLATYGRPTNHPLIAEHLDDFRRALATARAAVASERPNYYLVGAVSGACLSCHGPDRRAGGPRCTPSSLRYREMAAKVKQ